ncbi:MAG: hypothetical protein AAF501_02050 [Pseudomonadota bacterium]
MHIRKVTITLPPRLRSTAARDARLIAEALSERLGPETGATLDINIPGHGRSGPVLAQQVAIRAPGRGGRG